MRAGFRNRHGSVASAQGRKARFTRSVKRAIIPGYGRRGMGILHPKKALYNRVYRRTTFGLSDILRILFK